MRVSHSKLLNGLLSRASMVFQFENADTQMLFFQFMADMYKNVYVICTYTYTYMFITIMRLNVNLSRSSEVVSILLLLFFINLLAYCVSATPLLMPVGQSALSRRARTLWSLRPAIFDVALHFNILIIVAFVYVCYFIVVVVVADALFIMIWQAKEVVY